jgi:hypothetical protein
MTSEQSEFHNIFSKRGGIFDPSICDRFICPEFSKLFEYSKMEFYARLETMRIVNPKLPEVYLDFINNSGLNAVATKVEGKYYIGVNMGAVLLLHDLFNRLLTSPLNFPHIGDNISEKPKKIYNPELTDFSTLLVACDTSDVQGAKDSQRRDYAVHLTSLSINFLLFHEYGHIVKGHVDLLGHLYKDFTIAELNSNSSCFNSLMSQTMEMDADQFAFTFNLWFLDLYTQDPVKKLLKTPFYKDFVDSIVDLLFAAYSLFRLFGNKNGTLEQLLKHTHPPVGIRQRFMFRTLDCLMKSRLRDTLNELISKTIFNVENAFCNISESILGMDAIKMTYESDLEDLLHIVTCNWNDLKPRLDPYAYNILPPLVKINAGV